MQTPLEVEILIHYYVCAGDFPNLHAPAIQSAINEFVHKNLLLVNPDGDPKYIANTDALKPYIEALCNVPLPKQKWLIE